MLSLPAPSALLLPAYCGQQTIHPPRSLREYNRMGAADKAHWRALAWKLPYVDSLTPAEKRWTKGRK